MGDADPRRIVQALGMRPHPEGGCSVEFKSSIDFEKVKMGSDLNGPIPGVPDRDRHALPAFV